MNYKIEDKKIILKIEAKKDGKFMFKTRKTNLEFGESFATRSKDFNEEVYLEWQIGYDAIVGDVESGKKETKLTKLSFVGSNGKTKYPYELSELLYDAIKIGLIQKEKVILLSKEIENYSDFIDNKKIDIEHNKEITINNIPFEEKSIKLPALFMVNTPDGTQIEIHVKQQQYASGTQPMVYFCIPIKSFANYKNLLGRPSTNEDNLIYIFDTNNISVLFGLVKVFSMCSERHNFDIKTILSIILKQV